MRDSTGQSSAVDGDDDGLAPCTPEFVAGGAAAHTELIRSHRQIKKTPHGARANAPLPYITLQNVCQHSCLFYSYHTNRDMINRLSVSVPSSCLPERGFCSAARRA